MPFWFFLGKIISRALFQEDSWLEVLNYVPVRNIEFVGYTNKQRSDEDDTSSARVVTNVIEVHFSRPQPGEPIRVFWKPARGLIVQKIEECKFEEHSEQPHEVWRLLVSLLTSCPRLQG